jgi:hypothetical protein
VNRPYLFRWFAQYDHIVDQIAQMRFSVCCRKRLAAHEYRFDNLLSQMPASFQNCAETFGVRSRRPTSPRARSRVIEFYCNSGLCGATGNRLRL